MGAPKPKITLVPWDPESPSHIQRLFDQRIACRWDSELVEAEWRDLQRSGRKTIQWIVLSPDDPSTPTSLSQHIAAWPSESTGLSDTATSLGGKPRAPNPTLEFIPVGHISLKIDETDPNLKDAQHICTFYVSKALQGKRIGSAAMDAVEEMAVSEPLNAKVLTLKTNANENPLSGKFEALGWERPKISNEDWYIRRGYEIIGRTEKMWSRIDSQGREWWSAAVHMRKFIK